MNKCERCQNKESQLQCMNCNKFRNLCQVCDNIIHNLPTKKNHIRIPTDSIFSVQNSRIPSQFISNENTERLLNEKGENINNEKEKKILSNKLNKPVIKNLKTTSNNTEKNISNNSYENQNLKTNNIYNDNNNLNNINNIINQNEKIKSKKNKKSKKINIPNLPIKKKKSFSPELTSSVLNAKLYLSENYSKNYINEIRNIYKKEKEELDFKNKTLQNNLDSLKEKLTEQINELTKQLETNQINNKKAFHNLKKKYEQKLIQLNNEHEVEINILKSDIEKLNQKENELNEKYKKELSEKDKIILNLNNNIYKLQNNLLEKTEENYKMKNSFDLMSQQYKQQFNDDKNKLIKEYEDKLSNIVDNVESSKNKLLKLVNDREFEIKNTLDNKTIELSKLIEENKKLKEENKYHKLNLIKIRNERDNYVKQNEQIQKNENKNNSYITNNEINNLKEEIKKLKIENDNLKNQIKKFEKIIHNKINTNFTSIKNTC